MPRKPPERSYDPDQTRRALLDAALDLFAERGFRTTSTQDVADRAGVTKGAFYHHFETKDRALHILHDQFLDKIVEQQRHALRRYTSPIDQLARMAFDVVMVCIDYQKHVRVFFREQHLLTGETRDAILARRRDFTRLFQDTVRRGIAVGEFSAGQDADVAALGVLGLCIWSYQWYHEDGALRPGQVAAQFAAMALRGLGATRPAEIDTSPDAAVPVPS
ncbi:TetR/AcrR family transcriptional regulator [Pseudonocardia acaciae]|uniref:TetR/AcrR family transcriptional regulator n=1 Tax=Pseudonocardia acaciae TaxID=551276 RepID=UPI000490C438|nr:TetR/AcrR family transcriptional regulator [Pseudonocardia acaciae]